jgi:hypothetical protein
MPAFRNAPLAQMAAELDRAQKTQNIFRNSLRVRPRSSVLSVWGSLRQSPRSRRRPSRRCHQLAGAVMSKPSPIPVIQNVKQQARNAVSRPPSAIPSGLAVVAGSLAPASTVKARPTMSWAGPVRNKTTPADDHQGSPPNSGARVRGHAALSPSEMIGLAEKAIQAIRI